jgi:hypothetical protein
VIGQPARFTLAFLLAALVVAIGGCGTSAPDELISPVEGIVVDVDSAGLDDVNAFTIRMDGGRQVTIVMGLLENATEFPPAHLGEHLASGDPVRVWFRAEGDDLVAYRIEDAASG